MACFKTNRYKINNIEVCFLDLDNNIRVVTIPKKRLKYALKNGLKCDGSSIFNDKNIKDSDIKLYLDKSSFYMLPNNNAMCFAYTNYKYDARKKLIDMQKVYSKKHITFYVGAELEFFLFNEKMKEQFSSFSKDFFAKNKKSVFSKLDNLSYFMINNQNTFNVLNQITTFCKNSSINIEQFHHECGINQFELNFKYDSPVKTADNIIYLKRLITYFAEQNGLYACFLPKPLKKVSGSGMHVNISAIKHKKNIFYNKNDKLSLSNFAYSFIKNLFKHIKAVTYFANPINNSYQRLNSGYETPTSVCYSKNNRSALIRIPTSIKSGTRIELRSPDISCNPYLTFLAILLSGTDDSTNKINAKNIKLPNSLKQAKGFLKRDILLKNLLPDNYLI